MPFALIQSSLNAGELSPDLFGRVDLAKYKQGLSTCRNMVASYRGGVFSRPGTLFCGQAKQGALGVQADLPVVVPFQFSVDQGIVLELGNEYMRFLINGAYVLEASTAITYVSAASSAVIYTTNSLNNGDWVYVTGVVGVPQVNNRFFVVSSPSGTQITLVNPLDGTTVNSSTWGAYVSGGTCARVYTISTPWAVSDLPLLKWAESADVMSFTHPSYPPYDLARITDNDWTLAQTSFASSIAPPSFCNAEATAITTTGYTLYQYCATAIDPTTGEESIASPIATVQSVDIGVQAGSIFVNAGALTASSYNFYRAPTTYFPGTTSSSNFSIAGNIFGYVGSSYGGAFTDSNIEPDYTTTPPTHQNPFATGSIIAINIQTLGMSYSPYSTSITITSPTGSGFIGYPVVNYSVQEIVAGVVSYGGEGFTSGDTVNFVDASMAGSGAAGTLVVGPSTGTYPSVVSYFQERRFYANTNNAPDTYFASQPGAFTNFDSSIPTVDSDAIIGTPWAQQVNGIQWMIPMPGGLVILTGLGAWQLSGSSGGSATNAAITPANQVAVAQAYTGCSPLVRPIVINYDILYVQEKGSKVRDLSYNFFVNIYTGTDLTVLSNHLFDNHQILRWDWAEEPYKLVWAIRDDGILLCLTYLKEQEVYSWTRHDTNGLFESVCCVSEPPVNATYFVVKRLIQNDGNDVFAYFIERLDDRLWTNIQNAWCVDAGLEYGQNAPSDFMDVAPAGGTPTLQQPTVLFGGASYSINTYVELTDPTGQGAVPTITIDVNGVITGAAVAGTLTGYTNPTWTIIDPTGAGGGAIVNIVSLNVATVTSNGVFQNVPGLGAQNDVVRGAGGEFSVLTFNSSTSLTCQVIRPATQVFPNDPLNTVIPPSPGQWTIINPTSILYGLNHLEGMQVSVLADGNPITGLTVSGGSITLPVSASAIIAGLGFTAQGQTMYLDPQTPVTTQGRRKSVYNVVMRVENSGGPFSVGTDQPDASIQPNMANTPWTNLVPIPVPFPNQSPLQPFQLYSGDIFADTPGMAGNTGGQVAFQQSLPLPLSVLAVIPWWEIYDDTGGAS